MSEGNQGRRRAHDEMIARARRSIVEAAAQLLERDHDMLANYVSQTSIAHLTREKLAEVPLPVPNSKEQRFIADALSDVDALIASLNELIAKKRDIKTAAMQQLLRVRQAPALEPQGEVTSFTGERLGRGPYGSPRPQTLEPSDEPFSTCAPPRWRVDTCNGGRIYRWPDCWRVAVYVEAIHRRQRLQATGRQL